MNCLNCGAEMSSEAKFCNECGSALAPKQPVSNEAQDNKIIFVLAYLGILFFLPLVSCPNSKIGRFHANQGLLLLLMSIAGQIVFGIATWIAYSIYWGFGAMVSMLTWVWWILVLTLAIMGMVSANKGEQKPLPVIGGIKLIK